MRRTEWNDIFKFFLLYFLVFLAVEVLLTWAGLWNEERPFWLIFVKSAFISLAVTLVSKIKEIRNLLKKRPDERDHLR